MSDLEKSTRQGALLDPKLKIHATAFDAPNSKAKPQTKSSARKTTLSDRDQLSASEGRRWWQSQFNVMVFAFALLAVLAGVSILLAPAPAVLSGSTTRISADGGAEVVASTSPISTSPFNDASRAAARTDSQDILSELLAIKKQLENKRVTDWAALEFQSALQQAENGDELYSQQNFVEAITSYQSALSQMDSLLDQIPQRLATKIIQGNAAITEGKATLAKQRFNQALLLEQNSVPALQGMERANSLAQSLQTIQSAQADLQEYEQSLDILALQSAQNKFQQVLEIDAQLNQALEGQVRVAALFNEHYYTAAMSKGFQALFEGRPRSAKAAFAEALEFKPADAVAGSVYRQSLASDSSASLSSIISAAKQFEQQERWARAVSNYQAVLQRDPNQIDAKLGLLKGQARAQLDQRLNAVIADPLSLSKASKKAAAELVLSDARGISKKGRVLQSQISQIETLFEQLGETINIAFSSDTLTDVSLQKLGARKIVLGRFDDKALALKPGRYVVTGVRLGFQDVRQELNIAPGELSENIRINVVCDQALNTALQSSGGDA